MHKLSKHHNQVNAQRIKKIFIENLTFLFLTSNLRSPISPDQQKMASVEIDSRNIGKIIGPRGATIKQLQTDYNVHISISKEEESQVRFNSLFFCCEILRSDNKNVLY